MTTKPVQNGGDQPQVEQTPVEQQPSASRTVALGGEVIGGFGFNGFSDGTTFGLVGKLGFPVVLRMDRFRLAPTVGFKIYESSLMGGLTQAGLYVDIKAGAQLLDGLDLYGLFGFTFQHADTPIDLFNIDGITHKLDTKFGSQLSVGAETAMKLKSPPKLSAELLMSARWNFLNLVAAEGFPEGMGTIPNFARGFEFGLGLRLSDAPRAVKAPSTDLDTDPVVKQGPVQTDPQPTAETPKDAKVVKGNFTISTKNFETKIPLRIADKGEKVFIEGNLTVSAEDWSDLSALSHIVGVSGTLTITDCHSLDTLAGTDGLKTVGSLVLTKNTSLKGLGELGVEEIVGDLIFYGNPFESTGTEIPKKLQKLGGILQPSNESDPLKRFGSLRYWRTLGKWKGKTPPTFITDALTRALKTLSEPYKTVRESGQLSLRNLNDFAVYFISTFAPQTYKDSSIDFNPNFAFFTADIINDLDEGSTEALASTMTTHHKDHPEATRILAIIDGKKEDSIDNPLSWKMLEKFWEKAFASGSDYQKLRAIEKRLAIGISDDPKEFSLDPVVFGTEDLNDLNDRNLPSELAGKKKELDGKIFSAAKSHIEQSHKTAQDGAFSPFYLPLIKAFATKLDPNLLREGEELFREMKQTEAVREALDTLNRALSRNFEARLSEAAALRESMADLGLDKLAEAIATYQSFFTYWKSRIPTDEIKAAVKTIGTFSGEILHPTEDPVGKLLDDLKTELRQR